jgi:hypothetical protein
MSNQKFRLQQTAEAPPPPPPKKKKKKKEEVFPRGNSIYDLSSWTNKDEIRLVMHTKTMRNFNKLR